MRLAASATRRNFPQSRVRNRKFLAREVKIFWRTLREVCYPFFVQQDFQSRASQYHVSAHEFFRLLSYTASYF